MSKSKAVRLTAFVATAGATAALAGFAATGTGAYFTDSHDGAIKSTNGIVKVTTTPSDLVLSFDNILPHEYQTKTITYTAAGSGAEDVWLVPTGDGAKYLGTTADSNAYGRFAHFAVQSATGNFSSYNLASGVSVADTSGPYSGGSFTGGYCTVDANGHGGADSTEVSRKADGSLPPGSDSVYCPVPGAILLGSGLTNGATQNATVTFGWTQIMRTNAIQGQANPDLPFTIVATQHGVSPLNPNN